MARGRPLDGIRVVDLTAVWAGPKCTQILAYLGAEVIKVESPSRPDQLRGTRTEARPKGFPGGVIPERPFDRRASFNAVNRRKLGVTLDLRKPSGMALLKRLVAVSDIVIENFSVGVMDRLGLTYEQLRAIKPDIILLSMPGFGVSGPERSYVSWAGVIEAMSGITQLIGYDNAWPMREGIGLPDPIGGVFGAAAAITALRARASTGRGQFVELAQQEALMSFNPAPFADWQMNGRIRSRHGNRNEHAAPQGVYPCRGPETWIAVTVRSDAEWRALRTAMKDPDWAREDRFEGYEGRQGAAAELDARLASYTSGFEMLELVADLQAAGVAAGPVLSTQDVSSDPHLATRTAWEVVGHDAVGPYPYFAPLGVKFSRTDLSPARGAPTFGQDNERVLRGILGVSLDEIEALERDHVIGTEPVATAPSSPAV